MAMVTNIKWICPGCGSEELAQTLGEWDDPEEFHPSFVPVDRGLRYNPPCSKCGKFQLLPESKWTKYMPQPVEQS